MKRKGVFVMKTGLVRSEMELKKVVIADGYQIQLEASPDEMPSNAVTDLAELSNSTVELQMHYDHPEPSRCARVKLTVTLSKVSLGDKVALVLDRSTVMPISDSNLGQLARMARKSVQVWIENPQLSFGDPRLSDSVESGGADNGTH
jgi:hypothetical protein